MASKGRGITGLTNLGNTCFMNASLQCLSHSKPLTDYFLSKSFVNEINKNNPLGSKGRLAVAYYELLTALWN